MKTWSLFFAATVLAFPALSLAQSDTAHHRAVYSQINDNEKSFTKVTATHKDEPTVFALTGWLDNGEVRKIVAECSDDGEGVTEYYLEGGKPLFVYNVYYRTTESGKRGEKIEERLYFKDGSIFKWLTTEKPAPVFHGEDYAATTELYTENCAAFVAALKRGKAGGKAKAATQVVEGTFVGIEEGDYFHWNMRTKAGEELSFFILKPDASVEKVLENADAYAGRKCRVTSKKSMENIPEAGGKMEIEQILSVEWLGKK
ncbi:hypothetical protein [Prosthecobacter sp.]|uniref:hypothetical protein n=1 Tax=Prosthecobacter sp. TaxID=1965333 RepID=UPI001DAD2DDE|nr:hypothetical protein [Prosthecobacter sp.]MCB1278892.1 hypothetical protein [Prosthecobacter sp.]